MLSLQFPFPPPPPPEQPTMIGTSVSGRTWEILDTEHGDTEDPGRRHRQEGDSRGRQTRTLVLEDGAWLSLRLFLTLFPGICSFPQSQLDSQLMVRQTNPTPSFWKPIPKAALRLLGFLGGLRSGPGSAAWNSAGHVSFWARGRGQGESSSAWRSSGLGWSLTQP